MAKGYSVELRERVTAAVEEMGLTYVGAAEMFKIGEATVNRWLRRLRRTGSVHPDPPGGGQPPGIPDGASLQRLKKIVAQYPDATLLELRDAYNRRVKRKVSKSTIVRGLQRLGVTRKKKTYVATESESARVQKARADFAKTIKRKDPAKMVFIDESGARAGMNRAHGRKLAGQRVGDHKPSSWGKPVTMIAGLRIEGGIIAPWTVLGAINGRRFLWWMKHRLLPTLAKGTTIVLDNLRAHHMNAVREMAADAGCELLYLPPYSPDFNPIEMAWAKLKAILKRLRPPTARAVQTQFHRIAPHVTAADTLGFVRAAGYGA